MSKSKRSSQLNQDISEILSGSPAHDSTSKPSRRQKTTRSSAKKTTKKSTKKTAKKSTRSSAKRATKGSVKKPVSKKTTKKTTGKAKNKNSKSAVVQRRKKSPSKKRSTSRKSSVRSARSKTVLQWLHSAGVYLGKMFLCTGVAGGLAGTTLTYFSYLSAEQDVQRWLDPTLVQENKGDLGRLYSAPLSYWSGLPLSIEEVVEDLKMAGYDNVPIKKVRDKGDFGYALERKEIEIIVDDGTAIFFHFQDSEISKIVDSNDTSLGVVELRPLQLAEFRGKDNRTQRRVQLEDLPSYVPAAVLAVEDSRFYGHQGIDIIGLIRAVVVNVISDARSQGASTITQQLVKNLILQNSSKTYERKLKEVFRAVALEDVIYASILEDYEQQNPSLHYDNPQEQFQYEQKRQEILTKKVKDTIIELYLNEVYLGHSNGVAIYGVEQASRTFFGKSASKLEVDEAAMIAGMISSPNTYSPIRHPDRAKKRRNVGLIRLEKTHVITAEEREQYQKKELNIQAENFARRYPWFVNHAIGYIPNDIMQSGLQGKNIYSTINPTYQRIAEKAVSVSLKKLEEVYPESKGVQIALLSLHARTGNVVAMVGGRDFNSSQFNRATQANRSVGSIIKPLMTMLAMDLEPSISPGCFIEDKPISIDSTSGKWTPKNYNGGFKNVMTLRDVIRTSQNIPMVNLYTFMQKQHGDDWLSKPSKEMGLVDITTYPSSSLGAFSATPLQIAGAYTTVAADGIYTKPRFITQVQFDDEQEKETVQFPSKSTRISQGTSAWLTRDMMVSVMENGTAIRAKSFGVEGNFAGKTGTTNAGRDAWFVGLDRDIITVVWVGFDDSRALGLTGGKAAIPTWSRYNAWLGFGRYPFLPQQELQSYDICVDVNCAETTEEWFVDGYGPARRMRVLEQLWGGSSSTKWDNQCTIGNVSIELDGITSGPSKEAVLKKDSSPIEEEKRNIMHRSNRRNEQQTSETDEQPKRKLFQRNRKEK